MTTTGLPSETTAARWVWDVAPYAMMRFNPVISEPIRGDHGVLLDEIRLARRRRSELRQDALDELYRMTPTATDDLRRRVLLPASRAVFNHRQPKISGADLATLGDQLPLFSEWLQLWSVETAGNRALEEQVDRALEYDRERLQRIIGAREFLLAAGISSPDMARGAHRYSTTPIEKHNKRIRKSEPKLSRYAERSAVKTSPFSHFTVVAAGIWSDVRADTVVDLAARAARVEPNLLLVVRLLDAALKHPEFAAVVPFEVRSELRRTDRGYEYEVMRDEPERSRIYQGSRSKLAIGRTTPTELVFTALDQAGGSATLGELGAALVEYSKDSLTPDAVQAYLHKLRDAGLIVPRLRVDQQAADPALALAAELESLPGEPARVLAGQLRELDEATRAIGTLDGVERADAVDGLRVRWQETFAGWGTESRFDSPLYEDVALADSVSVGRDRWARVRADLIEILGALEPLNMDHPGQVLMRLMMVERYGAGGRCSYQDFVALLPGVFTAERVSLGAILDEVADRDPELTRLLELRERYLDAVGSDTSRRQVVLEPNLIDALATGTPAKFRRQHASVSAFLQPVSEQDGCLDSAVLNAALDGNGQFLSRFLSLWDDELTDGVRSHLRSTLPAGATELRPVQGFNANVHPAMLDAQFATPEEPAAGAGQARVDVRELSVRHDPTSDRLQLVDATGAVISPRYLGFLVPYLLPWELTGLYLLSEPSQLRLDIATELERRVTPEQAEEIRHYPRVRYGTVVLSRERWYVPREQFPVHQSEESLSQFLIRLDDWRSEHGIGQRVFLARLGADDRESLGRPKPMYADLRSPLHVRSLPAWLGEAGLIRVDEALPDPGAPLLSDPVFGDHVTEYLVECFQTSRVAEFGRQPVEEC